ncbi:MAG TPA: tetratricopeptide repeat protein [Candidatus Ozemobacteraceae bacterium]|nr:tetratricopeptide repeat protein [Candidatus Ozemobacteraceae bacterium]
MPRSGGPASLIAAALLLVLPLRLEAGELSSSLRTASELYRAGRLDEARAEALSVQKHVPDDLEALLILGRIDFEAARYADAMQWFRLASVKHPRHPLVRRYRALLEELEYRNGPFSVEPLPLPVPDRDETARRFKKGWFGPSFPHLSEDCKPSTIEPILSRAPLTSPAQEPSSAAPAPGAEPSEIPGDELEAAGALAAGMYFKAYIIYAGMTAQQPDRTSARLGLARAAIGMGRYAEATEILSPLLTIGGPAEAASEARQLAEFARRQIP